MVFIFGSTRTPNTLITNKVTFLSYKDETEKYIMFLGCVLFMKEVGIEGVVKHLKIKEDFGTTRRQKMELKDCRLELIRNNFTCTLLPISKEERYICFESLLSTVFSHKILFNF